MSAPDRKGAKKTGESLIERREAAKKPRGDLTNKERQERNKRNGKKYQEEKLRASFGRARDSDGPKRKWWEELKDEVWEKDGKLEVAPTRRKASRTEENLSKLIVKPDPLLTNLLNKSLQNRK
uniref:Uncharacterized protein n=1 Tax=Spumella elongata TaxID=89044 RepID=A0A7S3M851_9STRA|mmetsp:Transcript_114917/g.365220  ORF Transcript_114917/g.365220 Transcript_114917/m.365220 type:complete len:123 (-) Transcript_114917:91-459(-)